MRFPNAIALSGGCALGSGIARWASRNERHARASGEPRYTLRGLTNLALDGIINFSYKPLRIIGLTGIAIGVLALFGAAVVLGKDVTDTAILGYNPRNAPGWTSLILAILGISEAVQLFGLGILGEYIGRIFDETKHRPPYLIETKINCAPAPNRDPGATRHEELDMR